MLGEEGVGSFTLQNDGALEVEFEVTNTSLVRQVPPHHCTCSTVSLNTACSAGAVWQN